jgi:alpha-D-ribose 1-methylphosphonate 5-triphosphate synthase subunit PhnH
MRLRAFCKALLSCLAGVWCFLSPVIANAQTNPADIGQWAKVNTMSIAAIHSHLLPDGKVLMWGRDASGALPLWDPGTPQAISTVPGVGYDVFCSGHSLLPDGRVIVAGGHIANNFGFAMLSIFDPSTATWSTAPDMNAGRWYPTVTTLANGDALVTSGQIDTTVGNNTLPQVYQPATNSWRSLTGAQLAQALYPMMFVAPNGKVINVGPSGDTRYLDTNGTGAWSWVGRRQFGYRGYGSAVIYDGKILVTGGGDPPTATAEVIDLNASVPEWRLVASMNVARRQLNLTPLPDGTVLATGGTYGPGENNTTTPVFAAEVWNPATQGWTTLASGTVPRLYHSSAFLLPDGRVVMTGGDGYRDVEAFSPPYLFKGARPSMSSVPTSIGYGQRFTVQSAEAAGIAKVTLIRLGSVTHAFNMNQRLNTLQFTPLGGTLDITAPANGNLAPPGHYMLFIVDNNGVPSVGSIVQLGVGVPTPPPPPTLTSISPNSATAGGPDFTLTADGTGFVSGAKVRWNGAERTTTFVGATRLTAAIPASDIAAAGTAQVSVANPSGSPTGALPFTVAAAPVAPSLTSISPNSATAGGPAFTLTVSGSNFVSGASVRWNGGNRTTTFMSADQLTAAIPASDIAAAGTAQVSVANPSGATTGTAAFTVTAAPVTAPSLTSISPNSATAGGPGFTLTVNGSNFVSGASVRWNGGNRTTTFMSAEQLTAAIPASDIAAAGTAQVSVANPSGATTGTAAFTVTTAPVTAPSLTSISPNSATAGGPGFTLTVNGSNFVSGASVRWNGGNRTTTFMSAEQLTAAIPASDIATAGTAQVSVANPSGATTGTAAFTVTAAPVVTNQLTVTRIGSAATRGTITSNPAGINCGSVCAASFASGRTVTLTVKTTGNGVFAGWSGCVPVTGAPATCTVTMDGNQAVTATINTRK